MNFKRQGTEFSIYALDFTHHTVTVSPTRTITRQAAVAEIDDRSALSGIAGYYFFWGGDWEV